MKRCEQCDRAYSRRRNEAYVHLRAYAVGQDQGRVVIFRRHRAQHIA